MKELKQGVRKGARESNGGELRVQAASRGPALNCLLRAWREPQGRV